MRGSATLFNVCEDNSVASKHVSLGLKLIHGIGAAPFGIKNSGFSYFLLLFYSQVIGLDPALVGLAITISLVFDAISDPLIGYWSDNLKSRWGRRHPFMYASLLPLPISYYLLWSPPQDWSQIQLFWYATILAILVRTAITLYETPSTALTPELSTNYEERSSIIGLRHLCGWFGAYSMTAISFLLLFPAFVTPQISDGRFNPKAYEIYGLVAAIVMFVCMSLATLGTQGKVPDLDRSRSHRNPLSMRKVFSDLRETLVDRSFVSLFMCALLGAIATGLAAALTFYFMTYFWEFSSKQLAAYVLGGFVSACIGFLLAPRVTKLIGKKRGAMLVGLVAFIGYPMPILLRVAGALPNNNSPYIFWVVWISAIVDIGLQVCFQILIASMMADLVEHCELKTGRRSEGVFASSITFIKKCVQGVGTMAGSFILVLVSFPKTARPGEVPQETLMTMGLYYSFGLICITMLSLVALSFYRIDRATHEQNLQKLGFI
ncbi:sugar transporter [Pseudovibrio japonicus]|uniref:Sugar transporter n=1 Tax=Pseudovibrio japonicus TaxID=366534 RepID=A0ABQ3E547_9HYPH|nr:MFS transporter [Pseudovibrio japonicus]GHB26336.1 sugar transporter [Pseudovibrio japonicus]